MPRDEKAIKDFLLTAKKSLSRTALVHFIPTGKSLRELSALGLHVADVLRIIGKLEPCHWHAGPEHDRNGSPGMVMVFMYPYAAELLYIKLKTCEGPDGTHLTILSFHEEGLHG